MCVTEEVLIWFVFDRRVGPREDGLWYSVWRRIIEAAATAARHHHTEQTTVQLLGLDSLANPQSLTVRTPPTGQLLEMRRLAVGNTG